MRTVDKNRKKSDNINDIKERPFTNKGRQLIAVNNESWANNR